MFGLLGSVLEVTESVVKIALAPVEIAADITKAVVKPIAGVAEDVVDSIKDITS